MYRNNVGFRVKVFLFFFVFVKIFTKFTYNLTSDKRNASVFLQARL